MFGKSRMIAALLIAGGLAVAASAQTTPLKYPATRKVDHVDEYHGTRVADPYRWLEDLDAAETAAWVAAQNEVTFGFLKQIPQREAIRERLTELWNFERFELPVKEGGKYFFRRNTGLQNQSVLFVADSLTAEPRELLNPNTLREDGTVAVGAWSVSEDGKYLAYGTSSGGSDWVEFRVRDVATGKDLPDVIQWAKFTGASWTKDGKGFFYSRYDEPKGNALSAQNFNQKLYYHEIGKPQSEDRLVYKRDDQPKWGFSGNVTEDGQYLIITNWEGTERKNRVFYQDLKNGDGATIDLLTDFDAQYVFVGNDGPVFWFFTDLEAPRGRVIAIDTRSPERRNWKELIPQSADTLLGVNVVGEMFACIYMHDAHSQVRIHDLAGKHVRDVKLPGIGTVGGFDGKRTDKETFYSFTSFSSPATIYRYDMATGESTLYKKPALKFNPDDYETKQVFYNSKDGTRVPMFITHRKGLKPDGNTPTLLYGYGGFNQSLSPAFSVRNLVWMEQGGVYALANIRGGGEYGKEWHNAGRKDKKQNCFDDFIAAAEWLVSNGYTRPARLAILGGSNGGLLVAACMNQRPDLFGVCLPAVGVMDMYRFHTSTIGWAWTSDYGSSENPEDFKVQSAYSPLHNLRPGTKYPATLITTGDHDDRVVPWHSFKYAATLQACQAGPAPVLIRIETRAGHGAGKPTSKQIEEQADILAFTLHCMGVGEVNGKQ